MLLGALLLIGGTKLIWTGAYPDPKIVSKSHNDQPPPGYTIIKKGDWYGVMTSAGYIMHKGYTGERMTREEAIEKAWGFYRAKSESESQEDIDDSKGIGWTKE